MRKIISLLILVACVSAGGANAAEQSDPRLLGTWKSNRELTLPTLQLGKDAKPETRARLAALFGKVVVTYTKTKISAVLPADGPKKEWNFSAEYLVLAKTETTVVIRSPNGKSGEMEDQTITFEGPNRYWIDLGHQRGREYFDRVGT